MAPSKKPKEEQVPDKPKHPGGRPPLYDSVEELESVVQGYFAECDAKEVPYGVEGLALALGMDRRTLLNYEEKPEFLPTIKAAKQKVRACVEMLMLQGKIGTGAIFWLKANAKWEDVQEVKHSGKVEGPVLNLTLNGVKGGS